MKAVFCILIIAIVQATNGFIPEIQQIIDSEASVYNDLPSYYEYAIRDFLMEVDSMFDSVMQQTLTTNNFDLICYLNARNKYEPWYTNIAYQCMVDRNYTNANLTYWHNRFIAAMPEFEALFIEAQGILSARPECGSQDFSTYTSTLSSNLQMAINKFYMLSSIVSMSSQIVPVDILYGFSSELTMIFSYAQSDPAYDALSALADAEFKHMTIDSMTVINACEYAKWYFVSQTYAYYTSALDDLRNILEGAILRDAANFACTGQ